jgi:cold shock protein
LEKTSAARHEPLTFWAGAAHLLSPTTLLELTHVTTDNGRRTGIIKWYGNDGRHFGFITSSDGCDVFFHKSAVDAAGLRDLREGYHLELNITAYAKNGRPKAINLKLI